MVEPVVHALFLGVQGGFVNVQRVGRPLGAAHHQPGAAGTLLHVRRQFGFGFAVEQPARLALGRTVRTQQVRPAVYGDVQILGNNIEPAQAHIAEGSSVVLPDGNLDGIGWWPSFSSGVRIALRRDWRGALSPPPYTLPHQGERGFYAPPTGRGLLGQLLSVV